MSLRIRIQVINGNDIVVESRDDMKFSELYKSIQTSLSLTNTLKIVKNTTSLIYNRDCNKSLQQLGITNNCCLEIEIEPDLYINASYGQRTELIVITSREMKLPEFFNLVKTTFGITEDVIEMQMGDADRDGKKYLDLASQSGYSLKDLKFTNTTTVRVVKDEIRFMLELNGEVHVFDAKTSDTFEKLNREICARFNMRRIDCILKSKRLGVKEDGASTLGELGFDNNSKLMVLDHYNGGLN